MEMQSCAENVCCRSNDLALMSLDDNACITDHRNFEEIVVNPVLHTDEDFQRSESPMS